jgi:murein L,D-transpeptidase YafK
MHKMHLGPRSLTFGTLALAFLLFATLSCNSNSSTLPQNIHADQILVIKSQHSMTLLANGKVLKTYKVALGKGIGKAKQSEGDHETPEGFYTIDSRNAHSRFHRALHISYPNNDDRKRAESEGVPPGSQIMIHGIQNGLGWLGSLQHEIDWTDGCIAVTDVEIDEIWNLVPVGTPIEIRP